MPTEDTAMNNIDTNNTVQTYPNGWVDGKYTFVTKINGDVVKTHNSLEAAMKYQAECRS